LTLSGSATEQAKAPNASEYKLKYSATDGDSTAQAALSQFSGAGTGEGKLERPLGVAVDKEGNAWVIDRTNRRVEEFSESGQFLRQFGSSGSGNGQFTDPCGIAISSTGNIVVSDLTNNNVQVFSPTGQFIRKITAPEMFQDPYAIAPASGGALWISDIASHHVWQFSETGTLLKTLSQPMNAPSGLATDAAGNLWVSDTNENRILKFSPSGEFLMQFGSTGSGNGQFVNPTSIAAAPSGNIMVSDAGNNRLQEFQPNGVYLRKFGSAGTGLGQVTEERGLAFGPGNVLYLADAGGHRINRWSHADLDNQSGVVSTEVKVDGQLVEPKYAPGCATENCSINNRDWLFKVNAYSSGQHTVQVTATDGVGLTTTKEFKVTADSTPPGLLPITAFYTAPSGWLEQKSYSYEAYAGDGGSGVASLALKIDGKAVKSVEQACPGKGCTGMLTGSINMASYKGGEHPAELIATDLAGNTAKKAWTINVDPKGTVPASEAAATIEAVEGTEPESSYVAATDELISADEIAAGNNPGLEKEGVELSSTGVPTETVMTTNPSEGMTIEGPEDSIHIEPTGEVETTPVTVLKGEVAAVTSNTDPSVDTIIRPKYNGDMTFQSIRDATSPETFSWEVELGSRLSLGQIDSENIGVYHPDGSEAMLISAELAHDAVGKAVATTSSRSKRQMS
jgi:DNA-binding beta-propeller fold protein YncE